MLDQSLILHKPPLIEIEALAAKAVALLACKAEWISATIFCKPVRTTRDAGRKTVQSYWISISDAGHNMRGLYELKPQAPVVDFEIINKAVSDMVV